MDVSAVDDAIEGLGSPEILLAQVSDMHLRAPGADDLGARKHPARGLEAANAAFERAVGELASLARKPDLLVLTGDLVEDATPESYAEFERLVAGAGLPMVLIPGNHDRGYGPDYAGGFDAWYPGGLELPEQCGGEDFLLKHTIGGWDLVGVDTTRVDVMSAAHREAVSTALSAGERPAIVLTHSPLLAVGNYIDGLAFHDRAFMDDFVQHRRVKLVLSGHVHMNRTWRYHGAIHATCGSTSYGQGSGVGYSLIGLDRESVRFVVRRALPGLSRNRCRWEEAPGAGSVRVAEPALFEESPLCAPRVWPWRADPRDRD